MAARRSNLSNKRFGSVVAIKPSRRDAHGAWWWTCKCDCGKSFETAGTRLTLGRTKSCGCRQWANVTQHGQTRTGAWNSWLAMRRRCDERANNRFAAYGGIGIAYCPEWGDFSVFLRDMGERPDGHSLDRIDSNKGYTKNNCRWATATMQARNRSVVHKFDYMGRLWTMVELAELVGCSASTVRRWLIDKKLTVEEMVAEMNLK